MDSENCIEVRSGAFCPHSESGRLSSLLFVLVFPAIPFYTETICVPNCLHPSSDREPILANTSPGFECHSGFSTACSNTKLSCFCSCTWLTMASARHFLLYRHSLHALRGHISPNEFDYCKAGTTHFYESVCALGQFVLVAFTVILLTMFDVFVGNLPQEATETLEPRRHGGWLSTLLVARHRLSAFLLN